MRWIKRRHPKKSTDWVVKRYFKHYKSYFINNKWTFHDPETGIICFQFLWFSKPRFWPPVIGKESPDNPDSIQYWMDRQEKLFASRCISIFSKFQLVLAESQKLTCPVCEESLIGDEQIHMHHIIAKRDGGKDSFANLVLVHLHCHQHVHYATKDGERDWQSILTQFKFSHPRLLKGLKGDVESSDHLEDLVD
jgi:RNA-directed DNA polymerase